MKRQISSTLFVVLAVVGCAQPSSNSSATPSDAASPTTTTAPIEPPSQAPPDVEVVHPTNITRPAPPPLDKTTADSESSSGPEPEFSQSELAAPGTARLSISNQSFDDPTVHLTVTVDGRVVVDDDFEVGSQHNWIDVDVPDLAAGEHQIEVQSSTDASIDTTFTMPDGDARYVAIAYWDVAAGPEDSRFTIDEFDEPIMFL